MPIGRESGMPEFASWESFFDPKCMILQLGMSQECQSVAEFGCGYGTFTIPAALLVSGTVWTYDIDPRMIEFTTRRAKDLNVSNIIATDRDFMSSGTGLPDHSIDFVMLFNLLHIEEPLSLLAESKRILKDTGLVGIIHWRSDIPTPRGPSLSIRPTMEVCRKWGESVGLKYLQDCVFDCCHWHWGLTLINTNSISADD
jgi:ubiquinone/menaquinone biosynthesis C-methylase UbiE